LFEVLIVVEKNKKHWNDNLNQTMAFNYDNGGFMHQKVMKAIKVVVGAIC
jgi:hypothetical protein